MKFLYGVKGCCRCDSRTDCPKELKNSESNLLPDPREVDDGRRKWTTFCADFLKTVTSLFEGIKVE